MSQVIQHNSVDVVVLGMGTMSGPVAQELAMDGYSTVGIERGPSWDFYNDFFANKYDEWGTGQMAKYDHQLNISTATLRNNRFQYALPLRRYMAGIAGQIIKEGFGVGGMCQHYGGLMGRFPPWVYEIYSSTVERYGEEFLENAVPNHDVTDWPMTYDEYVPYYEEWERMWGVCGTNQGPLMPNLDSYPLPPPPDTPLGALFRDTLESMGYSPFPIPISLATEPYTNQYGVSVQSCVYDGWCGAPCNYVCETGAKANTAFRTLPATLQTGNFDLRLNSYIFRLDTDNTGKVTAARYYDGAGNVHVQPGRVFFNGLWGFNIIKLMRFSGIGEPYDPVNMTGSLGRAPAIGVGGGRTRSVSGVFENIGGNAYPAGNALGGGYAMLDLAVDNFDHTGLDFIGGAYPLLGTYLGGGPGHFNLYATSPSTSMIGVEFKNSIKDIWLKDRLPVTISPSGMWAPTKDWFIDLDPHHRDKFGDPQPRITLDVSKNYFECANYMAPQFEEILINAGASNVQVSNPVSGENQHIHAWPAHIRGGARIGTDPAISVFNKWQQCWTCENLFAAGEITEPMGDNTTTGGTHPAGPGSYVAAEGIKRYLQSPGPLV